MGKSRTDQEEQPNNSLFGAWSFSALGTAHIPTGRMGRNDAKKTQNPPGCLDFKRMENILLNNFILEDNFLTRASLGGNSSGEISRTIIFFSFSLVCISSGKHCPWKMASVPAPNTRLKAKECASKSSKRSQWKGCAFVSPEIYGAHFLPSPRAISGHSTSPFFKFTIVIWYLCCMRAESQLSRSGGSRCERLPGKGTPAAPGGPICL